MTRATDADSGSNVRVLAFVSRRANRGGSCVEKVLCATANTVALLGQPWIKCKGCKVSAPGMESDAEEVTAFEEAPSDQTVQMDCHVFMDALVPRTSTLPSEGNTRTSVA